METISAPCSPEQSALSAPKPFRNPKRKSPRGSVPRKSAGSLAPPLPPPSLPSLQPLDGLSTFSPPPYSVIPLLHSNCNYSQPPLLPLPRVNSSLPLPRVHSSLPPRTAGKATHKSHHQTPKKAVQKVDPAQKLARAESVPIGSFPKDFDGYPGPAFTLLSPPPSSLPMPRFSVKPKKSCNAEAAGTDDRATNDLRRFYGSGDGVTFLRRR